MKIIETTIAKTFTVPETVKQYLANDGKIFSSEEDCLAHENYKRYLEDFDKLIICPIHTPDVFNVYDADIYLMQLDSPEDLKALVHGAAARLGKWCDSYVEESAEKFIESYPVRVLYFENDSFSDIYPADVFLNQCLDAAHKSLTPKTKKGEN